MHVGGRVPGRQRGCNGPRRCCGLCCCDVLICELRLRVVVLRLTACNIHSTPRRSVQSVYVRRRHTARTGLGCCHPQPPLQKHTHAGEGGKYAAVRMLYAHCPSILQTSTCTCWLLASKQATRWSSTARQPSCMRTGAPCKDGQCHSHEPIHKPHQAYTQNTTHLNVGSNGLSRVVIVHHLLTQAARVCAVQVHAAPRHAVSAQHDCACAAARGTCGRMAGSGVL